MFWGWDATPTPKAAHRGNRAVTWAYIVGDCICNSFASLMHWAL